MILVSKLLETVHRSEEHATFIMFLLALFGRKVEFMSRLKNCLDNTKYVNVSTLLYV